MQLQTLGLPLEPMPTTRSSFGVAVVNDNIYAVGGYRDNRYLTVNEMYDPATDTWTKKTPMLTSRSDFGIAVYKGKIHVFGGFGWVPPSEGPIPTTEVYNPETDTWETKSPIPNPRSHVCASVVGDKIYLLGGVGVMRGWPYRIDVNNIYDPESDTWTTGALMPNYEGFHDPRIASAVVDNKIYMISDSFNQMYDPETDTWSSRTAMPTPIYYFYAGATSGEYAPKRIHLLADTNHQIYDPETDTWTYGTPAPTSRYYGIGVAIISDEIYTIGGYNSTTYLALNEKYTPAEYIPEFPSWVPLLGVIGVLSIILLVFRIRLTKTENQHIEATKIDQQKMCYFWQLGHRYT